MSQVLIVCALCGKKQWEVAPVDTQGLMLIGWQTDGKRWACRPRCARVLQRREQRRHPMGGNNG